MPPKTGPSGGPWTEFWDMHSGGGQKLEWGHIYIEAPEEEAKSVFFARFHRNPERVTCTCCGGDYAIDEEPTLEQITGYQRGCATLETPRGPDGLYKQPDDLWFKAHYYIEPEDKPEAARRGWKVQASIGRDYVPLADYVRRKDVLVIRAAEIKPEERGLAVPEEGYVWAGDV